MFSGLVQVHEDEGWLVVISPSNGLHSRSDDDKATERLSRFNDPPEDNEIRRKRTLESMNIFNVGTTDGHCRIWVKANERRKREKYGARMTRRMVTRQKGMALVALGDKEARKVTRFK